MFLMFLLLYFVKNNFINISLAIHIRNAHLVTKVQKKISQI